MTIHEFLNIRTEAIEQGKDFLRRLTQNHKIENPDTITVTYDRTTLFWEVDREYVEINFSGDNTYYLSAKTEFFNALDIQCDLTAPLPSDVIEAISVKESA